MSVSERPVGTADRARWRLGRGTRKAVLIVHIIASVALLGEVWGLVVLNVTATLTTDTALAHAAYRLMESLVFAGGIPLSMVALGSGITLSLSSRWGLFRHYWVFAKLLLLIAVILCGMLLFTPVEVADAVQRGTQSAAWQWEQVAVLTAQLAMLITATVLSVLKPRRRIGAGESPAARS